MVECGVAQYVASLEEGCVRIVENVSLTFGT